jgi:hypothetical protein
MARITVVVVPFKVLVPLRDEGHMVQVPLDSHVDGHMVIITPLRCIGS